MKHVLPNKERGVVMILILDLILGIFLDKIHVVWFGGGPRAVV